MLEKDTKCCEEKFSASSVSDVQIKVSHFHGSFTANRLGKGDSVGFISLKVDDAFWSTYVRHKIPYFHIHTQIYVRYQYISMFKL